jgi:hypothetical protein
VVESRGVVRIAAEAEANSHPTSVVCLAGQLGSRRVEVVSLQNGSAGWPSTNIKKPPKKPVTASLILFTGLRDIVGSGFVADQKTEQ